METRCVGGGAMALSEAQGWEFRAIAQHECAKSTTRIAQPGGFGNLHVLVSSQRGWHALKNAPSRSRLTPRWRGPRVTQGSGGRYDMIASRSNLSKSHVARSADRRAAAVATAGLRTPCISRKACRKGTCFRGFAAQCGEGCSLRPKGVRCCGLGQGQQGGGSAVHRNNCCELTLRIATCFIPLEKKHSVYFEQIGKKVRDPSVRRFWGGVWGHNFVTKNQNCLPKQNMITVCSASSRRRCVTSRLRKSKHEAGNDIALAGAGCVGGHGRGRARCAVAGELHGDNLFYWLVYAHPLSATLVTITPTTRRQAH